jgi:polyhydroxyalkanoate synthesis repressor PhaR
MKSVRQIHLYPNRRLYDLTASKYVTYADLLKLMRKGIDFEVIDSVRSRDHTNKVLLDIMIGEEMQSTANEELLPRGLLLDLIRAGNGNKARETGQFLSFSLESLSEQNRGMPSAGGRKRSTRDNRQGAHYKSDSGVVQKRREKP